MKPLNKSARILALEILLLVRLLDVLLWRTSDPFISESFDNPIALAITGWQWLYHC
jgi:hypothetical protein